MAGRRRLPLVAEQTLGNVRRVRAQLAGDFERELQQAARNAGTKTSCRAGCANCCFHPVLITALEGVLMYRWLAEHGRWTPSVQARIREHSETTRDLEFSVWFLSVIACPMLDEKTKRCTIYAARPHTCRVTFAFGDPDNCHPHRIEQSGLVNKAEVVGAYHREQAKIIKRHGLRVVLMPISMAILMGEKIVSGEIELEGADLAALRASLGETP
jgi:Fe-S-cluster containining protein